MKPKKAILFDASSLISLAMNGLLPVLEKLKQSFNGWFLITNEVKFEIIEKPMKIRRFKLEGLMIQQLLDRGVLQMPGEIGLNLDDKIISKRTQDIMKDINNLFIAKGKEVNIIDLGESSCLALSELLAEKKVSNVMAIDERTTRVLIEKPENLQDLLERKMHINVKPNREFLDTLKRKQYKIIRSAELMYVAYKKQLFGISDPRLLGAALWAVRFKGCSISDQEIKEIVKIG